MCHSISASLELRPLQILADLFFLWLFSPAFREAVLDQEAPLVNEKDEIRIPFADSSVIHNFQRSHHSQRIDKIHR